MFLVLMINFNYETKATSTYIYVYINKHKTRYADLEYIEYSLIAPIRAHLVRSIYHCIYRLFRNPTVILYNMLNHLSRFNTMDR